LRSVSTDIGYKNKIKFTKNENDLKSSKKLRIWYLRWILLYRNGVEEIRVLKDMAMIDLLSLNDTSLKREFEQLKKNKGKPTTS